MKLLHYTDKEFELKPWKYSQEDTHWRAKPTGLWVSVEGPCDWKSWCESEEFELDHLAVCYEVKLKRGSKILRLKTMKSIYELAARYYYIRPQWDNPEGRRICSNYEINWERVKEEYQGIIIAPYQWPCRLHPLCNWYYGWDCASGCLWDLTCIKEFKVQK